MKAFQIHGKEKGQLITKELSSLDSNKVRVFIRSVGICGSDLHYYFSGACGDFVIKAPFTCGHEASGQIGQYGGECLKQLNKNTRVAINPSHSCGVCDACLEGNSHLCESLSFLGSASTWPHSDGFMQGSIDVYPEQCFPLQDHISFEEGACAEPLSVAVHAVEKVNSLANKHVCVFGAGAIGLLLAHVAKFYGARSVTVVDIQNNPLSIANKMGVDHVVNILEQKNKLGELVTKFNGFDAVFEATGSQPGLENAIQCVKKSGYIIQVGTLPEQIVTKSLRFIMNKEIQYIGSMRFTNKNFSDAVEMINSGMINVKWILSSSHPIEEASQAFHKAKDKSVSCKVQVLLGEE